MRRILFFFTILIFAASCTTEKNEKILAYTASEGDNIIAYLLQDEHLITADSLQRGLQVVAFPDQKRKIDKQWYVPIKFKRKDYYVSQSCIDIDPRLAVREKTMWVRTAASIIADRSTSDIAGLADKGQRVEVLNYDTLLPNGLVNRYMITVNGDTGWVYGKYLVHDSVQASERYQATFYDSVQAKVRDLWDGGEAQGCDMYPNEKPNFKNNIMPSPVYALYLSISPAAIKNIDEYISLAKTTKINAFVLDMKDNECPAFKAETFEQLSPTNFKWGGREKEQMYHYAVKRLHEEGFYVIGRITCFKDSYFVKDHPECSITDINTGEPFFHNKAYWPSAFNRRVWEFNVKLAKECVKKFGLNEINFDYVRFPDRMQSVADQINYHNQYNESKVQAVQRFVQYATDELHELGVYVSIDVFGESANRGYTTPYGQYWPAISNAADVICGMPYPDHFANGYAGLKKPWNQPYKTLYHWGQTVQGRQAETASPAKVRTWIQVYHVMRHVDPDGIDYNAHNITEEIRGLYDAGCQDGYATWLSNSSLSSYTEKADAFRIDYIADYKQRLLEKQQAEEAKSEQDSINLDK